jgi:uncharacterized membrane protein
MSKAANRHVVRSGDTTPHHVVVRQQYSGPLPPASELEHYERAMPGLAERIVCMAEEEAAQRRKLEFSDLQERRESEIRLLDAQGKDRSEERRVRGVAQFFAFFIAIVGICSSAYVMVHGAQVSGSILASGTLVSIVTAFLYGNKPDKKKKDE